MSHFMKSEKSGLKINSLFFPCYVSCLFLQKISEVWQEITVYSKDKKGTRISAATGNLKLDIMINTPI